MGKRTKKTTSLPAATDPVLLYRTEDGLLRMDVRTDGETVWLSQEQMAGLFDRERSVITKHIGNVFAEGELPEEGNVQELHFAHSTKPVKLYSLNVIISVGYRVKSLRGTQFRIWATGQLREFLIKGFTLDDRRFKEQSALDRYFDELVERIRDIAPSPKRLWRSATAPVSGSSTGRSPTSMPPALITIRMPKPRGSSMPRYRTSSTSP